MKYLILLFLSASLLFLYAQDEVEFEVKKANQEISARIYIYTDSGSRNTNKAVISVLTKGDTLFYESRFMAAANDTMFSGSRPLSLTYEMVGDTLYANVYYGNNVARACVFVKGGIITNGYSIASKLLPPFQDKTALIHYAGTVNVSAGDSIYKCIKLIEATPYIEQGYWLRIKGARLFKYKRNMYAISIQYVRESDYLPVKILSAVPVKKYVPDMKLDEWEVEWKLRQSN